MKNITWLLAAAVVAASCKNAEEKKARYAEISKAAWLTGSWENVSENGTLTEAWEKLNDSTYSGKSYFIKEKDTLHFESVELTERNGEVIYSPTVQGQNDDLPVAFRMTSATEKQMVFENPSHDYPQKIVYTQVTADSLVAEISGKQQGKASSEKYPMKKK
jgi:hypothetical protein